jgi:hypothetical protein
MDYIFIIGLGYIFVVFTAIILVVRNPDLSFWLLLNMYFDPGGYISYINDQYFSRITFQDFLIIIILYLLINNWKSTFYNDSFKNFLKALFYFGLFYFIVYGGIVPILHDDFNYPIFLLKNRWVLYGLILMVSVYNFGLRGLKYLYLTTLFTGLVTLILYWLSILTNITLVQYSEFERYYGSAMYRIDLESYGIFYILFPLSVIVLVLSRYINLEISYKKTLYFVGMLMLISLIITLTRRTIIDIIGTVFIVSFLMSRLFNTKTNRIILRLLVPIIFAFLILWIAKPNYIGHFVQITTDTFVLLITGEDTRGISDSRISGGHHYPAVFETIGNNILLGTGYTFFHWEFIKSFGSEAATSTRGLEFGQMADAAQEIPIINMFFSFGIIGFILLIALYYKILRLATHIYKYLKRNMNYAIKLSPFVVVFSFYFIVVVFKLFTYNIWSLGDQFIGSKFQQNAFWIGLGFAVFSSFKEVGKINIPIRIK